MPVNLKRPVVGFLGNVCMCWWFLFPFFCVLEVNHMFSPLCFLIKKNKEGRPFYTNGWKAERAIGHK